MEKRESLKQVILGKLDTALCKSMKSEYSLTLYTEKKRKNSKCLKTLRHVNIKLLEEDIEKPFSDINCSNIFLDQSLKANDIKPKIKKWDLIKLKKLLHSKGKHQQNQKKIYGVGENICKRCG